MFLQTIPEKRSGRVLMTFVESYQDKQTRKIRQRTVETIGYIDEFEHLYPDVKAHFKEVAKEKTALKRAALADVTLTFSPADQLKGTDTHRKSIGYMPLSQEYQRLGLEVFLANRQSNLKIQYRLNSVLKLLVFGRVLFPASKKQTFEKRDALFEQFNFSLDDVYHSLSVFHALADKIKLHLHERVRQHYGRETELVYYDVTNYYFETDTLDHLRRKGVSKEHRPNPIVQMGLLMDEQGLPVTYDLFSGNTNDCETLMPVLKKLRGQYQVGRFIVVADRGLNTSNNTAMALIKGDGYVYGQSLLKGNKELRAFAIKEEGYRRSENDDGGFKIKSRIASRTLRLENTQGQIVETTVEEKQVFFYSDKYALRARAQRQEALDKAARIIAGGRKEKPSFGAVKYIKGATYDKSTGEILRAGSLLSLDEERIREEELYDGYYAIVSSEVGKSDEDIARIYRGLWRIEDSFRVTKSDLESRPVYVSREDHINAHFLTCFIALLLLRLVQHNTHRHVPVGQLVDAMRQMNGTSLQDNYYVFDHISPAADAMGKAYQLPVDRKYLRRKEIMALRKAVPTPPPSKTQILK